ncbi:hypothetical protein Tco_0116520 [Tanacetum coccineum]
MMFVHISSGLALQRQNDVCSHQFRPRSSSIVDVCSHQFRPHSSSIDDVCSHQFRPRSSTTYGICRQHFRPRSSKKRKCAHEALNDLLDTSVQGLVKTLVSPTPYVPPSKKDYEIMFQPLFDEYFNPPPSVIL